MTSFTLYIPGKIWHLCQRRVKVHILICQIYTLVMVLSTYWSWVFLASLCTVVFSCLYLAQSFVLFVCLALENAFCRLRSSFTPLRKDDGFLYSDTETKAEILNDQFHSVYTREDMTSMPEKGQSPYPDMPDIHKLFVSGPIVCLVCVSGSGKCFLSST
jgi:hypothetical protein